MQGKESYTEGEFRSAMRQVIRELQGKADDYTPDEYLRAVAVAKRRTRARLRAGERQA